MTLFLFSYFAIQSTFKYMNKQRGRLSIERSAGQGLRHLFELVMASRVGQRVPKARPGRVAPKIIYSFINHHEN